MILSLKNISLCLEWGVNFRSFHQIKLSLTLNESFVRLNLWKTWLICPSFRDLASSIIEITSYEVWQTIDCVAAGSYLGAPCQCRQGGGGIRNCKSNVTSLFPQGVDSIFIILILICMYHSLSFVVNKRDMTMEWIVNLSFDMYSL